jgi:hypothetical protein
MEHSDVGSGGSPATGGTRHGVNAPHEILMRGAPRLVLLSGLATSIATVVLVMLIDIGIGWAYPGAPVQGRAILIEFQHAAGIGREVTSLLGASLMAGAVVMGYLNGSR